MTDLKISALTDGGGLQADDEIPVARAGTTYRTLGVGVDGWISDLADTWTYASGSGGGLATFTIAGVDRTAIFTPGTRIKLTQTTVKYFVVISSSFSTNTTVTIMAGTSYTLANAAISANYHSYSVNPQGWPTWFVWSPTIVGWGTPTVNEARFCVIGRTVFVKLQVTGTSNSASTTVTVPITAVNQSFNPFFSCFITNSGGANTAGRFYFSSTTVLTFGLSLTSDTWTATGTKTIQAEFFYEI